MGNFTYCCVPHCRSLKKRNMDLSFFKFPAHRRRATVVDTCGKSTVNVRRQWICKLKMVRKVSPYMKVCSLHFVDSDFFPFPAHSKRRYLKPFAIPSVNLPGTNHPQPSVRLRKMCNLELPSRESENNVMSTLLNETQPVQPISSIEPLAPTFIAVKSSDFATETISSITSNSHSVAYNKLSPITGGVENLTQMVDFISSSKVSLIDNKPCDVKTESILSANCSNNRNNYILGNLNHSKVDDSNCIIMEAENQTNINDINEFNKQLRNSVNESSIEHNRECNQKSQIQITELYFSKGTLSTNENCLNDTELNIEPFILSNLSNGSLADTSVLIKTDCQEFCIKDEFPDEASCSYQNLHTEMIIKTDEISYNLVRDEIREKGDSSNEESTEKFLMNSPVVFSQFCGLPNMSVFNALLQYVEDDMKPLKGVTKFEQLFSILAKLHKNEDNLYLNKYIFPPAYVYTVEVLYEKLMLWCNEFPVFSGVPEVLTPEFDLTQKIVIIGIKTVGIRSNCKDFSKKVTSVKYLVAYTTFGEVFFVSNAFVGTIDSVKLIAYCGVLKKLENEHWILFHQDALLYAVQAKSFLIKWTNSFLCRIASEEIQSYSLQVVDRLSKNFKILKDLIPDFMLYNKNGICFLDRLVFVCCMLLNMLPKITFI